MRCRPDRKRSTASQPIPRPAATSAPPGSSSMKPRRDASSPAAQCWARYRTSARRMCGAISAKISAASRKRPVRLICCTKWQRHGARHRGMLHGRTLKDAPSVSDCPFMSATSMATAKSSNSPAIDERNYAEVAALHDSITAAKRRSRTQPGRAEWRRRAPGWYALATTQPKRKLRYRRRFFAFRPILRRARIASRSAAAAASSRACSANLAA